MTHVLDHLEQFTSDWIDWLQNPDDRTQETIMALGVPLVRRREMMDV